MTKVKRAVQLYQHQFRNPKPSPDTVSEVFFRVPTRPAKRGIPRKPATVTAHTSTPMLNEAPSPAKMTTMPEGLFVAPMPPPPTTLGTSTDADAAPLARQIFLRPPIPAIFPPPNFLRRMAPKDSYATAAADELLGLTEVGSDETMQDIFRSLEELVSQVEPIQPPVHNSTNLVAADTAPPIVPHVEPAPDETYATGVAIAQALLKYKGQTKPKALCQALAKFRPAHIPAHHRYRTKFKDANGTFVYTNIPHNF
ncbi:unnamed protein product [Ceutorhynchus assimilis]|uniref:Uncharacterized protein n=1 Tax=Ceutorhynchus assimilis TaxID=467358 RepID=A0A9N9MGJ2_9CUCU|nr:unnamed protein product [Ceutorhynchus assimilis]